MTNAPERYLAWRWEDKSEETRLQYTPDSKRPNGGTFVLQKEDHTLGNLIRLQLLRDSSVRYAGYRVPHPLIFDVHVKVETMNRSTTPCKVFEAALDDIKQETDILTRQFKDAMEEYRRNNGME